MKKGKLVSKLVIVSLFMVLFFAMAFQVNAGQETCAPTPTLIPGHKISCTQVKNQYGDYCPYCVQNPASSFHRYHSNVIYTNSRRTNTNYNNPTPTRTQRRDYTEELEYNKNYFNSYCQPIPTAAPGYRIFCRSNPGEICKTCYTEYVGRINREDLWWLK